MVAVAEPVAVPSQLLPHVGPAMLPMKATLPDAERVPESARHCRLPKGTISSPIAEMVGGVIALQVQAIGLSV